MGANVILGRRALPLPRMLPAANTPGSFPPHMESFGTAYSNWRDGTKSVVKEEITRTEHWDLHEGYCSFPLALFTLLPKESAI